MSEPLGRVRTSMTAGLILCKTIIMQPSDRIIELRVPRGTADTEVLNVHRGVLRKSSNFFQNAMKPEWQGLRERSDTIELPDYSVQELSNYIRWLYSGNIPIKQLYDTIDETRERRAQEADEVFASLAGSYVFGEKIMDAKYKNAVLMAMLAAKSTSGWNLGPNSVDVIYRGTPDTSHLRRFFADSFAIYAYDDSKEGVGWMSYLEQYPKEALVDAIKAMVKTRPIPRGILYHDPNWYLEQEEEEGEERDEWGDRIMSQSDDRGSDCSTSSECSEVPTSTTQTEGSCISDL